MADGRVQSRSVGPREERLAADPTPLVSPDTTAGTVKKHVKKAYDAIDEWFAASYGKVNDYFWDLVSSEPFSNLHRSGLGALFPGANTDRGHKQTKITKPYAPG